MIRIVLAPHGSDEYVRAVDLRRRILRIPLGLDFTNDEIAAEHDDLNLVAILGSDVVASLSLVDVGERKLKMRQVAVDESVQRTGLGTRLVRASEELARERGFDEMLLHARDTAVPFYLRLGYEVVGSKFEEVGIPHYKMRKALFS